MTTLHDIVEQVLRATECPGRVARQADLINAQCLHAGNVAQPLDALGGTGIADLVVDINAQSA